MRKTGLALAVLLGLTTLGPGHAEEIDKAVFRRTAIMTADLEASIKFYELLGFKEDRRVPITSEHDKKVFGVPMEAQLTFVRMSHDNTLANGRLEGGTIGLADIKGVPVKRLKDLTKGETTYGMPIIVMTAYKVKPIYERAKAAGATIIMAPEPAGNGIDAMVLEDPDGTRIEIYEHVPR
jgi:catechol 2,3-dioxygenase-like lactoylglutathione lyase family enzyme